MLLTIDQAAELLTVSVSTVKRLTAAGILPIVRVSPRRVAIPEAAVRSYRGVEWPSNQGVSRERIWSNSSKGESVFTSVCRRESPKPRRKSGKRKDAGKSSMARLVIVKN